MTAEQLYQECTEAHARLNAMTEERDDLAGKLTATTARVAEVERERDECGTKSKPVVGCVGGALAE